MANNASAMPGATTARLVLLEAAMAVKAVITPQTVPNRTEIGGPGGADRGEEDQARFEPVDLALDGHVEHLVDALGQAAEGARRALEGALPFAHGRDEDRGHARRRAVMQRAIEILQRLAGPENFLEPVHSRGSGGGRSWSCR